MASKKDLGLPTPGDIHGILEHAEGNAKASEKESY
jgi:hypothetical protein